MHSASSFSVSSDLLHNSITGSEETIMIRAAQLPLRFQNTYACRLVLPCTRLVPVLHRLRVRSLAEQQTMFFSRLLAGGHGPVTWVWQMKASDAVRARLPTQDQQQQGCALCSRTPSLPLGKLMLSQ